MPAAFTNCVLVSISRRTSASKLLRGQRHRIGPEVDELLTDGRRAGKNSG